MGERVHRRQEHRQLPMRPRVVHPRLSLPDQAITGAAMSRSRLGFVSIVALCFLTAAPAAAQTSIGGGWAFVCSDGKPPAANGSCSRGGAASGSQTPASNPAVNAAERGAEIERARQKLGTQRQALANSRMREAAETENQRRLDAERQAQFERERDAGIQGLKGVSREIDLRDAVRDTPSSQSTSRSSTIRPAQQAALRQATCALSVLRAALALNESESAVSESRFLVGQASVIADGSGQPQVQCGESPQWELPPGVDVQVVVARARAITTRAQGLLQTPEPERPARPLTADEQRIQAAFRAQQANEQRLRDQDAPVVAAQERINSVQQRKYDPRDAAAIRQEQQSKAELRTYVNAIQKLEQGKVAEFLDMSAGAGVDAILSNSAPKQP